MCSYSEDAGRYICLGLPPEPWPDVPVNGPFDRATYGPGGTIYIFSEEHLLDRYFPGGGSLPRRLMKWLRKLRVLIVSGSGSWSVPYEWADPALPVGVAQMRWLHVNINAKLADTETLTHSLNFRTAPAADVDQDAAAVLLFARQIRDTFQTAWNNGLAPATPMSPFFCSDLKYTGVTAAYLEQTQPAEIRRVGNRNTYIYPRPNYLVPTQYADFATPLVGTNTGAPLPFEVALCASFTTGLRGPRNRGRLYWGGLPISAVATTGPQSGNFATAIAQSCQAMTAALVHAWNTGTGGRLHIVSRAYATSVGVNGVRVGVVPDSQRRRRRSRLEQYLLPTAT